MNPIVVASAAAGWPIHRDHTAALQVATKLLRVQPYARSEVVRRDDTLARITDLLTDHPEALYDRVTRHGLRHWSLRTTAILALDLPGGEDIALLVVSTVGGRGWVEATRDGATWGLYRVEFEPSGTASPPRVVWSLTPDALAKAAARLRRLRRDEAIDAAWRDLLRLAVVPRVSDALQGLPHAPVSLSRRRGSRMRAAVTVPLADLVSARRAGE